LYTRPLKTYHFSKLFIALSLLLLIQNLYGEVSYVDAFDVSGETIKPRGVSFNNDGTLMFVNECPGCLGGEITVYSLSTGFDISTASLSATSSITLSTAYGIIFNNDGTKLYSISSTTDIEVYTLSSAFDISTASLTETVSYGARGVLWASAISFNGDGSKFYIADYISDEIYEYALSTNFDIDDVNTGIPTANLDTGNDSLNFIEDMEFNSDGSKLFVLDTLINDSIEEYTLSVAYSLATATHSGNNYTNLSGYGFTFNDDGSKLFAIESAINHEVKEYSVSPSYNLTSSNAAPTTANLDGDSLTYTEDDNPTLIDQSSNATVSDSDSTDFNNGSLSVSITSGSDITEDILSFDTSGDVSLEGTSAGDDVSVGGQVVGTLDEDITEGNDLVVNFDSNATPARTQTLIRAITYENTDTASPSTSARTIRINIADGDGASSTNADITVTVAKANDSGSVSIDNTSPAQGQTLTATVSDDDGVSGSISYQWQSGGSNVGTNSNTYTTGQSDVGNTITVIATYTDDEGTAETPTSAATSAVSNVNDAPTISGTPLISATVNVAYSFSVTTDDIDNGDSLSLSISGEPSWLSISQEGIVSGTPATSDSGTTDNIIISVSDGTTSTALEAFTITVDSDLDEDGIGDSDDTDTDGDGISDAYEIENGLDPFDNSDASIDSDGDGINNLDEFVNGTDPNADDYGPVISLESDVTIQAAGLLTTIPNNLASATDGLDGDVSVNHNLSSTLLAPGSHIITWQAEDTAGNVSELIQTLNILPLANFQLSQSGAEGNTITVTLSLNGESPSYPVTAEYSINGTAENPSDHNAESGSLIISEGTEASISLNIVSDDIDEADETIIFTLDTISNAAIGSQNTHTISISELNQAPIVSLSTALDSNPSQTTSLIDTTDSQVTVTANILDIDTAMGHSCEWFGINQLDATISDNSLHFNPQDLNPDVYLIEVLCHDNDIDSPEAGGTSITLEITENLPILTNTNDSDSDGINDLDDGYDDNDKDGVPNYLDSTIENNLLAIFPLGDEPVKGAWYIETQFGLSIRLSLHGSKSSHYSPLVESNDIHDENFVEIEDSHYEFPGGIYDFIISDIPSHAESVFIVIPQLEAVPADAIYRILVDDTWINFTEDANNALYSAQGSEGNCPPPSSENYTEGLTEGHLCIQVEIEDGGVNDLDDKSNGSIVNTGGVGEPIESNSTGGNIRTINNTDASSSSSNNATAINTSRNQGSLTWGAIFLLLISVIIRPILKTNLKAKNQQDTLLSIPSVFVGE